MGDDDDHKKIRPARERGRPDSPSFAYDAERLDRLVMSRVQSWISLREVLRFSTFGFLYSYRRTQSSARERRAEDPDR